MTSQQQQTETRELAELAEAIVAAQERAVRSAWGADDRIDVLHGTMEALAAASLPTGGGTYPHESGDVFVLGPEVIAMPDGSVVCWRGRNYVPQAVPSTGDLIERDGEFVASVGLRFAAESREQAVALLASVIDGQAIWLENHDEPDGPSGVWAYVEAVIPAPSTGDGERGLASKLAEIEGALDQCADALERLADLDSLSKADATELLEQRTALRSLAEEAHDALAAAAPSTGGSERGDVERLREILSSEEMFEAIRVECSRGFYPDDTNLGGKPYTQKAHAIVRAALRALPAAAPSSSSGDRPSVRDLEEMEAALKRPEVRIVSPETDQAFQLDAVYSEPDIEDPDRAVTVVHLLPPFSGESGGGEIPGVIHELTPPGEPPAVYGYYLHGEELEQLLREELVDGTCCLETTWVRFVDESAWEKVEPDDDDALPYVTLTPAAPPSASDGGEPPLIEINGLKHRAKASVMTGAELRYLPTPPVADDMDLFEVVTDGDDRLVGDEETVELDERSRFVTVPRFINAGASDGEGLRGWTLARGSSPATRPMMPTFEVVGHVAAEAMGDRPDDFEVIRVRELPAGETRDGREIVWVEGRGDDGPSFVSTSTMRLEKGELYRFLYWPHEPREPPAGETD